MFEALHPDLVHAFTMAFYHLYMRRTCARLTALKTSADKSIIYSTRQATLSTVMIIVRRLIPVPDLTADILQS